jgi:NAD(P)-dependent dehydrogenase (short-subunit alcohol dehydrogenase family)
MALGLLDLSGRRALVTGGGTGLGRQIATGLADAHGLAAERARLTPRPDAIAPQTPTMRACCSAATSWPQLSPLPFR